MEITESFDKLYSRSSESENYVRTDVIGFSEGSVIVDYLLYFRAPSSAASTTSGSVKTILQNAVNEAQEGEGSLFADVDAGSIVIEEVLDRHESTTVSLNTVMPLTQDEGQDVLSTESTIITQPSFTTREFDLHTTISLEPDTTTQTIMTSTQPDLTPTTFTVTWRPVLECGTRMMYRTQRIIGGQETQQGKWPWLVSLQNQYGHFCGAVIIGNIWILTAAHCTYDRSVGGINVFLNSTIIDHDDGYYAQIDEIYMHPDYNDETLDYDIALLRLRRSLVYSDTVSPICLETNETDNIIYDECFIAGWGNTDSDVFVDSGSDILLEANVPVIPRTVCDTYYIGGITERMICAGYEEGEIDSCSGDSGGPLMCPSNDGSWYVSGVTSWGIGCAQAERPGVYANVPLLTSWVFYTMQYWYESQVNTRPTNYCTEITEPTCLDVLPYSMTVDNGEYSEYEDTNITPTTDQLAALASCHPNAHLFLCSYLFTGCPVQTAPVPCQQFCYEVTSACAEELKDIYDDFYAKCDLYPSSISGSDTLLCDPPKE
ncbi:transmembrane protease serine 9-like isoform X3 [Anneissia japonica]|uniref:transmembrane protease serine 9-like isoform X2 n=1 Tax=Anneissia japonica TaxID=1529436 RepID=UPI0014255610|nr:transmembrane protease serine 9-like isoform X2 [Anneissia japonica]XP_033108587.1 transmembrane protease serine 9-like isoform X3 [Anneissia japonica]